MPSVLNLRQDPLTAAEHLAIWQSLSKDQDLAKLSHRFETDS